MTSKQKQLDIIELANEGKLINSPEGFLTEENLIQKNSMGRTIFQLLAQKSLLNQIPQRLITERVLLERDSVGACGIHYLAKSGSLNQLPTQFQTAKYLNVKDYFGLGVQDYEDYNKNIEIYQRMQKTPKNKKSTHKDKNKATCYDYVMEF
jgi:hypothetical protein